VADSQTTDAEIITASLETPAEFGQIFHRHYQAVYRYVARRRQRHDDAADVAADIFLRAFRIRHRYDATRPNCLPWLYGIAQNVVGDRLRRVRREQRVYLAQPGIEEAIDHSTESDQRTVAQQISRRLNTALGRLSKKDRETLLLFALEGLTYGEIAQTLGIPVGTVGSRIARARRRILELIPDLEQMIK